jgi:hypothetical protein
MLQTLAEILIVGLLELFIALQLNNPRFDGIDLLRLRQNAIEKLLLNVYLRLNPRDIGLLLG